MSRPRKVALLGGVATTLKHAPWDDPSWTIWSHSSVPLKSVRRVDRWFDVHPPHCYKETRKCGRRYWDWLRSVTVPVYMQEKDPEVPASVRYPRERIQAEYPGVAIGSQGAWMVALALVEGYEAIGLFGIHYQAQSEYFEQRANFELWVGIAMGRGVKLVIPEGCPVAREPAELYGYESHSTPEKYAARKAYAAKWRAKATPHAIPASVGRKPGFESSRLVVAEARQQEYAAKFAAVKEALSGTEESRTGG